MEKREIKFSYIVYNIHLSEVSEVIMTLEDIEQRNSKTPSWIWTSNCNVIAKRQFTGLRDKNGIEIYEGDVVKYGTPFHGEIKTVLTGEIVYNDFCACFQIKYKNIFNGSAADMCHKFTIIEVIGNIYQPLNQY